MQFWYYAKKSEVERDDYLECITITILTLSYIQEDKTQRQPESEREMIMMMNYQSCLFVRRNNKENREQKGNDEKLDS